MQLANGNVPIERSVLPEDALLATDATVQRMMDVAEGEYGMRSPKIRALAINIVRQARVREKDYYGEVLAVHKWVKTNIRYMKDPLNQETLSHPEETAFNSKAGDCDDMTILEIALLGSIGIQAWPVVIGVAPGIPSHVYLRARVPGGSVRKAGKVINLDPIMKNWAAGREAPANKVKIAHDYRDGNYMQGIQRQRTPGSNTMSDLGDAYNMLPGMSGMGTYVATDSYLDTEDSQVGKLLKPDLAAATGSVANVPHVTTALEGIDGMFGGVVDVGVPARDLGPRGPMTRRAARNDTRILEHAGPREISAKVYDVPTVNAQLNRSRGKAETRIVDSRAHVVSVQNGGGQAAKAAKSPIEERNELAGLIGALGEIQSSFLPGLGAMSEADRVEVAQRAATVGWWASFKARVAAARAGWYQERAAQARLHGERLAEAHARQGLMQEQQNAQRAENIASTADGVTQQMARLDPSMAAAIATTEAGLDAGHDEASRVDGLLGLSAADLQPSSSPVMRQQGRSARPVQVEQYGGTIAPQQRELVHLRKHRKIVDEKLNQLQTIAQRHKGSVRREQARQQGPRIMAPIHALSIKDPSMEGRRALFRGAHAVTRIDPTPSVMAGMGTLPAAPTWLLVAAAAGVGLYLMKRK